MLYSVLHFVLNDKQYLYRQLLFVTCCVQWWSLENPHAATQHARDSPKINVFWAASSSKVLPYHRVGNCRHSHYNVMEVWTMPHYGKDDSITFFFKQNGPVSQFLPKWQNFSTIISHTDKGTDRQANSEPLCPWIWLD